ncbi:hypothetical protein D3C75_1330660 [compost metagenome]
MDLFAVKKDLVDDVVGSQDLQDRWVAKGFQDFWVDCRHRDAAGFDEAWECDIYGGVTQAEQN